MKIHCWDQRTELEKCLFLILLVTVPVIFLHIGLLFYYKNIKAVADLNMSQLLNEMTGGNYVFSNSNNQTFIGSCNCPNLNCDKKMRTKFISSISEKIYEDDFNDYKFKCLALLLSSNYILTFKNCLSTNTSLNIRSSSDYWSTGGYTRQVSRYTNLDNLNIIAKVSEPLTNIGIFIKVKEIDQHELSKTTKVDVYRWMSKFNSSLKRRSKYDTLIKIQLKITKCTDSNFSFNGFCTQESKDLYSNEDLLDRDPVFLADSNIFIGNEIKRMIFNDTIEHYYQIF